MANGDIAAGAGITLVPPSSTGEGTPGKVQMGYDQMNRILDTIVLEDNKVKAMLTPEGIDAARDLTALGLAFSSPYFGRLVFQIPTLAFPTGEGVRLVDVVVGGGQLQLRGARVVAGLGTG